MKSGWTLVVAIFGVSTGMWAGLAISNVKVGQLRQDLMRCQLGEVLNQKQPSEMHVNNAMFGVILRPDGDVSVWRAAPGVMKEVEMFKLASANRLELSNGSGVSLIVQKKTE